METITTIGIDLAKSVFQLHGVNAEGRALLCRQLRRSQMLEFFRRQSACLIGMEACASAHYWARELIKLGHTVRLMPPSYVKAYVKRGKTDAADAEAICEAVSRPSMQFVPVKSEETQGLLMTHKTREFPVRQQTQIGNTMRAHLGEFGITVPKGIHNVERLITACSQTDLPAPARKALHLLADQFVETQKKIEVLTTDIRAQASANEEAQRLQTIPGIGPITASALVSALPDLLHHSSGRYLREAGARLWFLPAYSPDLNPIEQTFSKINQAVRIAQQRTVDAVIHETGKIVKAIRPDECRNYINAAGYASAEN